MKKLISLLLLIFIFQQSALADLGNCLTYYAKFYLTDGSFFNGSIEVGGDGHMSYLDENGQNEYTSDEGMMRLFKDIQISKKEYEFLGNDYAILDPFTKVKIYKDLIELTPKGMSYLPTDRYYTPKFGFAHEENIIYLDSTDLDKIIFWEVKETNRWWLTSDIVYASVNMMKTLQNEQYWNRIVLTFGRTDSLIITDGLYDLGLEMYNYNPKNNVSELKRLAQLKLYPLFDSDVRYKIVMDKYNLVQADYPPRIWHFILNAHYEKHFRELQVWFWERGILILNTWDTC